MLCYIQTKFKYYSPFVKLVIIEFRLRYYLNKQADQICN